MRAVHTSDAVFSECGKYRYTLERHWGTALDLVMTDGELHVLYLLLNPSTATAVEDDPTMTRCIAFAQELKCTGMVVCNIFAYRATDPRKMKRQADPIGEENDAWILHEAERADLIVCGWGNHGLHRNRGNHVAHTLTARGLKLWCFGITKQRQPKHPLYLASASKLSRLGV